MRSLATAIIAVSACLPLAAQAGSFQTIHSFADTDGNTPLALVSDGTYLYGATELGGTNKWGTVFKLDPSSGTLTQIYGFGAAWKNGGLPNSLFYLNGLLYGAAGWGGGEGCTQLQRHGCGTIFSADPASGKLTVLHTFAGDGDGFNPYALTDNAGVLYGATGSGDQLGTIFSYDIASGSFATNYTAPIKPHDWGVGGFGVQGGQIYATENVHSKKNNGSIYEVGAGGQTLVYRFRGDDGQPGNLIPGDGVLYGVAAGGTGGHGVVYSFDPATSVQTVIYNFQGGKDGFGPRNMVLVGGTLYGITSFGGNRKCGTTGCGTIFELNPTTGAEKVLYIFKDGDDGSIPTALVAQGSSLYGTTQTGGAGKYGTVFEITPK